MGATESYWVHISRGGNWLGAGFLLMGSYVLTAHHCLNGDGPGTEDIDVEVKFENGETLRGRIHRRCPEADLALIYVPESGRSPVFPRATRPSAGWSWQSPYQSHSGIVLTGMIQAVLDKHKCDAGGSVEAMQLGCEQDLEDYAGYSGSPVESGSSTEGTMLFGILIEQHLRHYPANREPRPASRVLIATTLSEVGRRFDCFAVQHLIEVLPSSSDGDAPASSEKSGRPAASDVQLDIEAADAELEALAGWYRRGLLDEQQFTRLTEQVITQRLHLPGSDGERGRE